MIEGFFIVFIVFLGVIVIGSIMGMMSSGRITKLEAQNRNLNERLKTLEAYSVLRRRAEAAEDGVEPQPIQPKPISPPPVIPVPVSPVLDPEPMQDSVRAAVSNAAPAIASSGSEDWTPPSRTQAVPKRPKRNLEELIGGQWSVWVGGFALLVGAVLLIRFSIEAGIFGPGARILMASVLGIALLLAGEWLKRSDDKTLKGKLGEAAKALQGNASVPGLLSAVGVFTLLGASYAAHELYGLISAPLAFAALGIISVGAMALSLRQGPLLAAIGLLASLATPMLIQTQTPNFIVLVGYLLVVGFAALAVGYRTKWRWLEVGTVAGWLGWSAMSIQAATSGQMLLWGIFLAIGFIVTVLRSEQSFDKIPAEVAANENTLDGQLNAIAPHPYFAVGWGGVAALLVGVVTGETWASAGAQTGFPSASIFLSIGAFVVLIVAAALYKRQSGHIVTAGFLALGLSLARLPEWQFTIYAGLIAVVVLLALRETFRFDGKEDGDDLGLFWPIFAVGLALSTALSLGFQDEKKWSKEIYFAVILGYSALFAAAAFYSHIKSRPRFYTACLTLGAAAAWWTAWAIQLDGLALSLALSSGAALMVAAMAFLRLPGARAGVLGLTGLVFAHAFLVQFPEADSLSARPFFNALWAYLALPTAILGAAGYLLQGKETDTKTDRFINGVIEAAALAGVALFAVFQIRHLSNNGFVYVDKIGFEELGLQVSTGLCFTLAGLSKRFSGNLVLSKMAEVISYATLAIFALGSLLTLSPLLNGSERIEGNVLFNSLTTGLLAPTVLMGLCAWRARGRRPDAYINVLGGLSLLGGMMWITAQLRFIFNGAKINIGMRFSDLELWTISAVWLAIGIALLVIGVWQRERAFRIASGIVIILTVLKAFLIDMAGLEGVLRAVSFVVLGLVLIVIGRAYQRYWLSDKLDVEMGEAT